MISVWVKLGETGGSMEGETKFVKNAMFLSKDPLTQRSWLQFLLLCRKICRAALEMS